MLAQRMRDLVTDYGRELRVRELEPVDETAVHHDLAAGHRVRVHLLRREGIDFPVPAGCVRPEGTRLGNQALRDAANACRELRILVKLAGAARLLHLLRISLLGSLFNVRFGYEHLLLAFDADG